MPGVPTPSDPAQHQATVMAVAARRRLLQAVSDEPLSPSALAARVGVDEEAVVREAESLASLGLVECRDGKYRRLEEFISDEEWATLPIATRREQAASGITQIHVEAAAAVDAGGFDRPDMHLTHSPLALDEAGWQRATAIMLQTFEALQALAAQTVEDPEMRATAVLLLYTDGSPPEPTHDVTPLFGEREGRERAVELAEAIQQAVTAPSTSWLDIVALADQLRVVARAAGLARPHVDY